MNGTDPEIRVFVSSTFNDMGEEREQLRARVAPQLRRMASERGVVLSLIDLRWGVTAEQAEDGKVVPICLRRVESCRPYFIGILGARYGSTIPALGGEIERQFPWLERYPGASLTELEIRCGALNAPHEAWGARFYFREDENGRALAARNDSIEDPDTDARARLERLKLAIRDAGLRVSPYRSVEELGTAVLRDLERLLDERSPMRPYAPPSGRQRIWMERVGDPSGPKGVPLEYLRGLRDQSERIAPGVRPAFVGRRRYLDELDAFALGSAQFLGVHGPPGSGKSALLAEWAARTRQGAPITTYHAEPPANGWAQSLGQMAYELDELDGVDHGPFPGLRTPGDQLAVLSRACVAGPRVLILDGVDAWDEHSFNTAAELIRRLPAKIRLICATRNRLALTAIAPNAAILELEGFSPDEQRDFIREELARHGKSLSAAHIEQLVVSAAQNPLELRTVLDELRTHASFEDLARAVESLSRAAKDRTNLYAAILARLERDFRRPDRNLVADALGMMALARDSALTETDWEGALELTPVGWAELRDGLRDLLRKTQGGLTFRDADLHALVERSYLQPETRLRLHAALARQFAARPKKSVEVPYHLAGASDWNGLRTCLLDFELSAQLEESTWDHYWNELRDRFDREQEHLQAFAALDPSDPKNCWLWRVGNNLGRFGCVRAAEVALTRALAQGGPRPHISRDLASLLWHQARPDDAERVAREAFATSDEPITRQTLASVLASRALSSETEGDREDALERRREVVKVLEPLSDSSLPPALAALGWVLLHLGRPREALEVYERARSVLDASAERPAVLARVLAGLGFAQNAQEKADEAIPLLTRALELYSADSVESAEHRDDVATAQVGLGRALTARGVYAEAEAHLESARSTFAALHPDHASLPAVALSLARLYAKQERFTEAVTTYRECIELAASRGAVANAVRAVAQDELAKLLGQGETKITPRANGVTGQ